LLLPSRWHCSESSPHTSLNGHHAVDLDVAAVREIFSEMLAMRTS
jgi:hypothetical protein